MHTHSYQGMCGEARGQFSGISAIVYTPGWLAHELLATSPVSASDLSIRKLRLQM